VTIFDRFIIKLVASAGLCGAALVLSPDAAAGPLIMGGGYACIQGMAGDVTPPVAAEGCGPASGPLADMDGVPLALPGPMVAPVPAAAPVPLGAPVPVGAPAGAPVPVAAPVPAGAPLSDMADTYGGKGDPIRPAPAGGPLPGQPVLPGPSAAG
jgi:hypothetical protein